MGRKCSTLWDGTSCKSGYATCPDRVKVSKFPKNYEGKQGWVISLPNYINIENVTDNMGICEKHWKPDYETITVQGSNKRPAEPRMEFGTTWCSFSPQTSNKVVKRNIEERAVSSEVRLESQNELENSKNIISFFECVKKYSKTLPLAFYEKENSLQLIRLSQ